MSMGIAHLVRLAEIEKAQLTSEQVLGADLDDFQEPIQDGHAPSQAQIDKIVSAVAKWIEKSEPVNISCGHGRGRTGTLLTCVLLSMCYSPSN